MTVRESLGDLWGHFSKNHSFEMSSDFKKVCLISENEEADKACVLIALEDLEKSDILKSKIVHEKRYFILNKPLSSFEQTVAMKAHIADLVAKKINSFCKMINDDTDLCDPASINENDLKNLVYIINWYENQLEKVDKPDKKD